jgi:hypothetical protein
MGKLTGLIQFTGKFDGLSFYEMNGKIVVRKTGGFDGEKIKTSPNYVRVRENSTEFAQSAVAGKYFRNSISLYLKKMRIPYVHNSIVSLFQQITKFDVVSSRGARKLGNGIVTVEGIKAIRHFEFDKKTSFASVFPFECHVDFENGTLQITDFDVVLIKKPKAATHLHLQFIFVGLDFLELATFDRYESAVTTIELTSVNLVSSSTMSCAVSTKPILLGLLFVSFSQQLGGDLYPLQESYLKIIDLK